MKIIDQLSSIFTFIGKESRTELAVEKGVPPYIICSDKTLKDMCAKCPVDSTAMAAVYGMGAQKIESYGARFTQVITAFLNEHGGETATAEEFSGMTVDTTTAAPARKKKLPFYIAPEKLDEVELTDTCMLSELTNRINALCGETDRKKLTASFINQLRYQMYHGRRDHKDLRTEPRSGDTVKTRLSEEIR